MLDLANVPHRLILASVPFEVTADLSNFTAVTLKSCSLEPIQGPCRFEEVSPDTFMNRWGLDNPGVHMVMAQVLPSVQSYQKKVIVSAFFAGMHEVQPFIAALPLQSVTGLELNVTCPNRSGFDSVRALVEAVNDAVRGRVPIGIKANLSFPLEMLSSLSIDFLTYSNTIPHVHTTFGSGGLSGNPLQREVLQRLPQVRKAFGGTLIACGGVKTFQDYQSYLDLGVDLVAVGSHYLKSREVVFDILSEIAEPPF